MTVPGQAGSHDPTAQTLTAGKIKDAIVGRQSQLLNGRLGKAQMPSLHLFTSLIRRPEVEKESQSHI